MSTDFDALTKWFYENHMALNAGDFHVICLLKDTGNKTFQKFSYEEQQKTKNTRVTVDNKLTFKSHMNNLCKKVSRK